MKLYLTVLEIQNSHILSLHPKIDKSLIVLNCLKMENLIIKPLF